MSLPGADKGGRFHQPQDHIDLGQRMLRHVYHVVAQLVFCLVDTRRIQKDDLSLLACIYSLYFISGCLRLIGCDRDLLSDQPVHQC